MTAAPARMIRSAQTVAKTGRFMKKSTNIQASDLGLRASDFGLQTSDLVEDAHRVPQRLIRETATYRSDVNSNLLSPKSDG
jgi:hypothetical protein